MRDLLLRWFKEAHMQKPWPQMSEGDQRTWINRIEERAELLVNEVIEHVNHGDFPVINAMIESFTVKKGEVKVVTKGFADNEMLSVLNDAGEKRVQITVMRNDQFDQERDQLNPDPDQPGLPGVKMGDAPGFEEDGQGQVEEPPIENPDGEQAAGEEILTPKSDFWRAGFNCRMSSIARDKNPFNPATGGEEEAKARDWFAGWDAADFDSTAPALAPKDEPAPKETKPRVRKPAGKAGPIVEPDIKADEDQVQEPAVDGEQQTDGDATENGLAAITDHEDVVIETDEQANAYGVWCRKDGRGVGGNPFPTGSDLYKAWMHGYSDQRRAEKENPPAEEF